MRRAIYEDDVIKLLDKGWKSGVYPVASNIHALPSAEPEERTGKRTETHACDLIRRQDAIDALKGLEFCHYMEFGEYIGEDTREVRLVRAEKARDALQNLPSAQPETAKRIVGKSRDGMTLWYQCDMCYEPVDVQDNYCRGCGRRLIDE